EPDLADFAPVRVDGADVEVADGCPVRGAADRGFLHEPLGDLLGEVQAVELGDGGHDAVHEHPGGGLVDVLHDGDRKSTRLNSSHVKISYAVFCLKKKRIEQQTRNWVGPEKSYCRI